MTRAQQLHWQESHSRSFLDYGDYFVPQRDEQTRIILDLIPPSPHAPLVVELCSGAGLLSRAILARFRECEVLALEGSEEMRIKTRDTCHDAGSRLQVSSFELADRRWRTFKRPPHAIVSSLAVHHLDANEKWLLFRDLASTLDEGGVLIVADIVRSPSDRGLAIAARQWDEEVRHRAQQVDGNLRAFSEFQRLNWNYFRDPDGQPIDKPSSLFEQLDWLRDAGLQRVDCAWMTAGHAIFYGYK